MQTRRKCEQCNTLNDDKQIYCVNCGKYLKGKITNTNVYSLIGKSYKLSSPIINGENGKIIIGDQIWNASSKLDIDEGEEVIIKEIIGTKLIVERKM